MNYKVFSIFLLSIISLSLYGQEEAQISKLQLGPTMMLTSTNITFEHNYGSGLNDYLFTPGFSGGIQGEYHLSGKNYIGAELLYSIQGQDHTSWKTTSPDTTVLFLRKIDLNYFKMPIYYKRVYSNKSGLANFYYNAGIYIGVLQYASSRYIRRGLETTFYDAMTEKNNYADQITQPEDFKELFRPIDIGLSVGWGMQYRVTPKVLFLLEARAEIGLTDINDKDWRFPHRSLGYRSSVNSVLGLKLSTLFDL
jgi:hypothetical protein